MKEPLENETNLQTSSSLILSRIAGEVREFYIDRNCSTLSAVRLMKAELLQLRADKLQELAYDQINNSYVP